MKAPMGLEFVVTFFYASTLVRPKHPSIYHPLNCVQQTRHDLPVSEHATLAIVEFTPSRAQMNSSARVNNSFSVNPTSFLFLQNNG
jgi:hypothetical protein